MIKRKQRLDRSELRPSLPSIIQKRSLARPIHFPSVALKLLSGGGLSSLTAPQPYSLAVLLQLGDELIALPDHILVLLVLVVWAVGFDDTTAVDAVDGAGNASRSDESCEVAKVTPS